MSKQNPIVMIVEDEELLLQAISKKLKLQGMTAITYNSGNKAIESLSNSKILPDIIWLDYYLKDMDGLEFMTKLKEKKEWAKIPVIVVSNSATPDKVNAMLADGVRQYYLKAKYRMEDIINDIQSYIT